MMSTPSPWFEKLAKASSSSPQDDPPCAPGLPSKSANAPTAIVALHAAGTLLVTSLPEFPAAAMIVTPSPATAQLARCSGSATVFGGLGQSSGSPLARGPWMLMFTRSIGRVPGGGEALWVDATQSR